MRYRLPRKAVDAPSLAVSGWSLEQSGLVEDVLAHGGGLKLADLQSSLSTHTTISFRETYLCLQWATWPGLNLLVWFKPPNNFCGEKTGTTDSLLLALFCRFCFSIQGGCMAASYRTKIPECWPVKPPSFPWMPTVPPVAGNSMKIPAKGGTHCNINPIFTWQRCLPEGLSIWGETSIFPMLKSRGFQWDTRGTTKVEPYGL